MGAPTRRRIERAQDLSYKGDGLVWVSPEDGVTMLGRGTRFTAQLKTGDQIDLNPAGKAPAEKADEPTEGKPAPAQDSEVPVATVDKLFMDLDEDREGELIYETFARKLQGEGSAARSLAEVEPKPTESERLQRASMKNLHRSIKSASILKRLKAPMAAAAPPTPVPACSATARHRSSSSMCHHRRSG